MVLGHPLTLFTSEWTPPMIAVWIDCCLPNPQNTKWPKQTNNNPKSRWKTSHHKAPVWCRWKNYKSTGNQSGRKKFPNQSIKGNQLVSVWIQSRQVEIIGRHKVQGKLTLPLHLFIPNWLVWPIVHRLVYALPAWGGWDKIVSTWVVPMVFCEWDKMAMWCCRFT